jgi:hypothetical protein
MIRRIAGLPCGLLEVEQLVGFRPGHGRKVCEDVIQQRRAIDQRPASAELVSFPNPFPDEAVRGH